MKNNKVEIITLDDVEHKVKPHIERLEKELEIAKGVVADELWRQLTALTVNCNYIVCFNYLKNKEYRNAWREFEKIEILIKNLELNCTTEFLNSMRIPFIKEYVLKYQYLYPYCLFTSPEMRIKTKECSICGHIVKPRSRCEHKKGHLYEGKICHHIVRDCELVGISIVEKPVQKYSVMHDDSTLNFTHIDYLMNLLQMPFEHWDVQKTTKSYPRNMFNKVAIDSTCPCTSGKLFRDCCEKKEQINIPHIAFSLKKDPKEMPPDYFPH